jgi:hypothetical protein
VIVNVTDMLLKIDQEIARLQKLREGLVEFEGTEYSEPKVPTNIKIAQPGRAKRTFSPEGLERIREAQRARWRKARRG